VRPSRSETLMEIAELFARRSTCARAAVGCVIAREGRILSTGYNGAPAGMKHCNHIYPDRYEALGHLAGHHVTLWEDGRLSIDGSIVKYDSPDEAVDMDAVMPVWDGCKIAVHAEANAIAYAARYGMVLEETELYTTFCPCLPCAQLIITAGITKVFYRREYRDRSGLALLESAGFDMIVL
jgi:dCMP deaminase